MKSPFKFLVHQTFLEQSLAFVDRNSAYCDAFRTQCKKACVDPVNAGELLRGIAIPELKGKVYKCWVGGPRKFRFVYILHSGHRVVLPVLITLELRSRIDWDKLPWQEYSERIYSDFINGNLAAFQDWTASLTRDCPQQHHPATRVAAVTSPQLHFIAKL